ncbi:hypothetical protein JCM13580A_01480 [Streptomyces drozdowiczii]|uniref:hypothetical protein n=1 Tax=Streptomyces drozdowiczii TaxID=202862 RepID=UPI0033789A88
MRILVPGAGVAGPVLAYRLARYGFRVTVENYAPAGVVRGGRTLPRACPKAASRAGQSFPDPP